MIRSVIAFSLILIFVCSCVNQTTEKESIVKNASVSRDTTIFSGLYGTWYRQNKDGFTLIEIKDTSDILYYEVMDRHKSGDTSKSDRFWYYRSKAKMGSWQKNSIWIATDQFRFDYRVKGDTLIEQDKMGDQGVFIKVFTDEQKAYKAFNTTTLKGQIIHVNKVGASEYFVLNNRDNEFSFTSIPSLGNKQFSEIAAVGDSVIKPQFCDTLTIINKLTKKTYRFGFVKR